MPVLSCQKDNKKGFKWGRQGVCFTQSKDGLTPREQAARVGRAIAVQRAESLDKDQAMGADTLGGFLVPIDDDNSFVPMLREAYENHLKNNSFELPDEPVHVALVADHGKIKLFRLADGYGEWYFISRDTNLQWLAQKMPDVGAFAVSEELSGILNKETVKNLGWGDKAWDKFLSSWVAESVSKQEKESDMKMDDFTVSPIEKQAGIQFIIGRLKGETTTTVQAVLFDKEQWTVATAKAWLRDHDFLSGSMEETDERLRFRQLDPGDFKAGSFRTIDAGDRRASKRGGGFPTNEYNWTVQETFHAIQEMSRKFSPEEAKLVIPAPDSSRTCGACRFYLRDPLGGPIGRCQVVEGPIPWFANSALYIDATAEAAASFAAADEDQGVSEEREEEEMERIAKRGVILKTHDPGFVLSPILVPDEVDLEGDIISPEEIESAAHEYMAVSQNVGLMHQRIVRSKDAMLVESYIARGDHKISGHTIKQGTWLGGFRILNEKIRQAIKDGKLTGVSIGGVGLRTPVED